MGGGPSGRRCDAAVLIAVGPMDHPRPPPRWRPAVAAVLHPARRLHAAAVRRWLGRRGPVVAVVPCPTVVVAPHHDDETIGCGGLIALKRRAGADVTIVILTDGADYRGRDAGAAPVAVAAARRAEAVAAAAALGVPADRVRFLDRPDGRLASLAGADRATLVGELVGLLAGAAEVYVTHRRDGHPDHEAAHALVVDAVAGSAATVIQYPVWLTWLRPLGIDLGRADLAGLRVVPIGPVADAKAHALAAHASQLATLPRGFLTPFRRPYEVFFTGTH